MAGLVVNINNWVLVDNVTHVFSVNIQKNLEDDIVKEAMKTVSMLT